MARLLGVFFLTKDNFRGQASKVLQIISHPLKRWFYNVAPLKGTHYLMKKKVMKL